jgi:UPF0271 protein
VREQVLRLRAIAAAAGAPIAHVKPHGALYNAAADDRDLAAAIARGVRAAAAAAAAGTAGTAGTASAADAADGGRPGAARALDAGPEPPLPRLVGLAGSASLEVYRDAGFVVAAEAFADRRYEPDGRLRSRALSGALLEDPDEAAAQAVSIARDGRVTASDGSSLPVAAGTLCLHGDTPGAVRIAAAVRAALAAAGIAVAPLPPLRPQV